MLTALQERLAAQAVPTVAVVGLVTALGLVIGRGVRRARVPSIIGFMLVGLLLGPSVLNLIHANVLQELGEIPHIALGFVAFSIGVELSLPAMRRQGPGIVLVIFATSLAAFVLVTLGVYAVTGYWPIALIFGALAPASAPAGTVAVIRECRARGPLTEALYAVVGFDDGLAIVIFGLAAAAARFLLLRESSPETASFIAGIIAPAREIGLSLVLGVFVGMVFCLLARRVQERQGAELFILVFAVVLVTNGLCLHFHLSLILTNMVIGMVVVNTQPAALTNRITRQLAPTLPLLFILFFAVAGANLHVDKLPAIGVLGLVYIVCRFAGKLLGGWFGAPPGMITPTIRKYVGLGIQAQAGVAIGLALIVQQDFADLGAVTDGVTSGARMGATVITTITATSVVFEIIGPILARYALEKAGEAGGAGS